MHVEHKGYCWIIVRCNKLTCGSSGSWLVPLMEMHPFCPKICNSPISSDSIWTRKHKARLRHKVDCRNCCTKCIFMEQNFKIEYALVLHCWPWNEQFPIDQALDWSIWSACVDNFYNNYLKPLSAYKNKTRALKNTTLVTLTEVLSLYFSWGDIHCTVIQVKYFIWKQSVLFNRSMLNYNKSYPTVSILFYTKVCF